MKEDLFTYTLIGMGASACVVFLARGFGAYIPQRSMYPITISIYLDPHSPNKAMASRPTYLGTWTLTVRDLLFV